MVPNRKLTWAAIGVVAIVAAVTAVVTGVIDPLVRSVGRTIFGEDNLVVRVVSRLGDAGNPNVHQKKPLLVTGRLSRLPTALTIASTCLRRQGRVVPSTSAADRSSRRADNRWPPGSRARRRPTGDTRAPRSAATRQPPRRRKPRSTTPGARRRRRGDASGAVQLRDGGRHGHYDPGHQQHQRPVQVAAEGDAREVGRADAPRHDGVGDAHAHLRELRDDEGHGEHAERAEFRQHWPAIHRMHRVLGERRRILQQARKDADRAAIPAGLQNVVAGAAEK